MDSYLATTCLYVCTIASATAVAWAYFRNEMMPVEMMTPRRQGKTVALKSFWALVSHVDVKDLFNLSDSDLMKKYPRLQAYFGRDDKSSQDANAEKPKESIVDRLE